MIVTPKHVLFASQALNDSVHEVAAAVASPVTVVYTVLFCASMYEPYKPVASFLAVHADTSHMSIRPVVIIDLPLKFFVLSYMLA